MPYDTMPSQYPAIRYLAVAYLHQNYSTRYFAFAINSSLCLYTTKPYPSMPQLITALPLHSTIVNLLLQYPIFYLILPPCFSTLLPCKKGLFYHAGVLELCLNGIFGRVTPAPGFTRPFTPGVPVHPSAPGTPQPRYYVNTMVLQMLPNPRNPCNFKVFAQLFLKCLLSAHFQRLTLYTIWLIVCNPFRQSGGVRG